MGPFSPGDGCTFCSDHLIVSLKVSRCRARTQDAPHRIESQVSDIMIHLLHDYLPWPKNSQPWCIGRIPAIFKISSRRPRRGAHQGIGRVRKRRYARVFEGDPRTFPQSASNWIGGSLSFTSRRCQG
ncbi:hypothetical protein D779_3398 [Imhoffiella purpurea]|uniref:Uncharacterized protein n=1 Tax=Imhoffiella purpurea TaxID=1249627 RepID=W9VI74_9GAMM|nr:hypothetical protein D779_3398 [Imhoffiella purpurea]